jgi:3-phenylpropionate/trans-cinnamate dioxygenase ferredoxin reductase subunit
MTSDRCVILGAGHAAASCALALRKEGWTGPITMVGDEPSPPYHRPPLSKAYVKGEVTRESLLIRPAAVYEQQRIQLVLGVRAEEIDRARRHIRLGDGALLPYDRLVLATGSLNRRPPIDGLERPGVFFLRTAADADALREASAGAGRVVLVGGGYIGLELAASFRSRGLSVTLLEKGPRILSRVTAPELSAFFQAAHEEEGVAIHAGVTVAEIRGAAPSLRVVTRDGDSHEADLVIVGTGAAPNTALAAAAGLEVEQGIVVDGQNRTSDPGIYAIGDCARQFHPLYERALQLASVQNATDQAKTAAAALTGKPVPPRPLPWFWSDQFNIKLQIAGLSAGYTSLVLRGAPDRRRSFSAWYFRGPRLLAVDAVNDPAAYVTGRQLIERQEAPDPAAVADPSRDLKSLPTHRTGVPS